MLELLHIASWTTWLIVAFAAALSLAGVVLMAHARLLWRGERGMVRGLYDAGGLATSLRWGVALLGLGILLWGLRLGWSAITIGAMTGGLTLVAGLEIVARWEASGATERKVENQ